MNGFVRASRSTDFGFMEVMPAVVLIVVLFLGGDWADEAATAADESRLLHGQAVAIAMINTQAAEKIDFHQLVPTDGYVPMASKTEDMPSTESRTGGPDVYDAVQYDVEMRVTNLDTRGLLRRIEIRVGYDQEAGDRIWVGMATVRQGSESSRANASLVGGTSSRRSHS